MLVHATTNSQNEVLIALLKEMNIEFEITTEYEYDYLQKKIY